MRRWRWRRVRRRGEEDGENEVARSGGEEDGLGGGVRRRLDKEG